METIEKENIAKSIKKFYWVDDINCATTMIKILSEKFGIQIEKQVIDSAVGMHGAGAYGAQCGLVEGSLMFLGIYCRHHNLDESTIVAKCNEFAKAFEEDFKSLQCSILRPEGFKEDNPPHLCEPLTCRAAEFSIEFISNLEIKS